MRLFVAIIPPGEVLADLDEFVAPRREAGDGPRWISSHYWHLTLAFIAKAAPRDLDELEERLAEVAVRTHPFELTLAGVGVFPNPAAAKVLWSGVAEGGAGPLSQLAWRCRTAAGRAGTRVDGTTFRPHLTLGRWRTPVEATKWLRAMGEYRGPAWPVESFALIHSELGHAGPPRYKTIADFTL